MKAATIKELKEELTYKTQAELLEYCLKLSKFKKENKELLTYLLFDASDEPGYIQSIREFLQDLFKQVNTTNIYFAKKTIRKIVRTADKFTRYSDKPGTETQVRIFICNQLNALPIDFSKSQVLQNVYSGQLKKINKLIAAMHEDLQHDYSVQMQSL